LIRYSDPVSGTTKNAIEVGGSYRGSKKLSIQASAMTSSLQNLPEVVYVIINTKMKIILSSSLTKQQSLSQDQ